MKNTFAALRELCGEIADLRSAAAVLEFDQQTAMPANGGEGRARQLSLLARLAHERTVSDRMGELLEALEPYRLNCAPESDDFCLLRNLRRDFDRQRRIPSAYVSEFSSLTALAFQNWMEAREADEFGKFAPYLERIFDLRRAYSDFFAPYDHIYDPQLDDHEPGMKTRDLLPLFTHLRREQTRLVEAITARPHPVDALPSGHFPEAMQWALNTEVAGRIGFDFRRGALARSEHPFTTTFHLDDVRITTRLFEDNALSALFSTLHEAGHALYEQNIAPALDRTPLGTGASLGWHESQSRLWENLVGRSRAFWRGFFPRLQARFPGAFDGLDAEQCYAAVNRVAPSAVRVEADEATYNLHIMLRVEIEIALMERRISVADLPELWRVSMREYLGIVPETDREGVLQDVHWACGSVGYFPTYTLGNVLSVQMFDAARTALPDLEKDLEAGNFAPLREHLTDGLYRHGAKFYPDELIARLPGKLDAGPYLRYLQNKYGELYGV